MQLEKLSALELGRLVRNRSIRPTEVIQYFEHRINQLNPLLNAFVYLNFEDAYDEAKQLEQIIAAGKEVGPLAGVPIALKDFLPTKRGWPATHGGVEHFQTTDDADSEFYKACMNLDAIAIGKTNAPSFGFRATTDNKMFGPTRNPYNLSYNSGGSSGGSAAAVGSRLVPLAEGGDAGGSIRVPAAWCGVFGMKPSAGLVPSVCRPDAWTATHPYCCGGPITRSVDDAIVVLNEMARYDPRDPISAPIAEKLEERIPDSISQLQVKYTYDFGGIFPEPEAPIITALQEVQAYLDSILVQRTEPAEFQFNFSKESMEYAWLQGISIDSSIDLRLMPNEQRECIYRDTSEEFRRWDNIAFGSNMLDYRKFHEVRTDILDSHLKVFDDCDIIIAPVTGCMPVKNSDDFNTKGPSSINEVSVDPLIGFAYTYLENMTGFPAASVPICLSSDGLPIGIQVIAPRYLDHNVLGISKILMKHFQVANPCLQ